MHSIVLSSYITKDLNTTRLLKEKEKILKEANHQVNRVTHLKHFILFYISNSEWGMCFSSCHFSPLCNISRERFKWLMTKMAPDFSFRKNHFLCLKCNEKNIHQYLALECGYSQLINHKPWSICWSWSLSWEIVMLLPFPLCPHLST